MGTLKSLFAQLGEALAELRSVSLDSVSFGRANYAVLMLVIVLALALMALLVARARARRPGKWQLALPAVLPTMGRSGGAWLRHLPLVLCLAGVPFFVIALADPYTAFTEQETSRPGRRIAVMIDASASMNQPFHSALLNKSGGPTYFATVAAAEYFMKLRMEGPHRDLIALIEFGNEAYVVTPFTTDYQNILLSMKLIAEPDEWYRFPDQGTIIIQAIKQGTALFKAFDFLEATGNLMVIFSDGQDTQTMLQGRPIEEIMAEARKHRIPVYFIRMAFNKSQGGVLPDSMWKRAVEQTGGRFYPAADERTILRAVHEIDRLAPASISIREYVVREPRYAGYTLIAVILWLVAAIMKLGLRQFRTFP